MSVSPGLNGLPVGIALAVRAEAFSASLAARSWVIRQKSGRRAHLLLRQASNTLDEVRASAANLGNIPTAWTIQGANAD